MCQRMKVKCFVFFLSCIIYINNYIILVDTYEPLYSDKINSLFLKFTEKSAEHIIQQAEFVKIIHASSILTIL